MPLIEHRLAVEFVLKLPQVHATIKLLDNGATVPFVARYRKEATGGLDGTQLRRLEERLHSLREFEKRRLAIISLIEQQNKMTPILLEAIKYTEDRAQLEDLYLSYRKKRRTRTQIAHEAGLQTLADLLLNNPRLNPQDEAAKYCRGSFITEKGFNPGVPNAEQALEGAQQILIERFAEYAPLLERLRGYLNAHTILTAKALKNKRDYDTKYIDYHDYAEATSIIPSHRVLALMRGERESILKLKLCLDSELEEKNRNSSIVLNPCESLIARQFNIHDQQRSADVWLTNTVRSSWRTKIFAHLEAELMSNLREHAEKEAIQIFAKNLQTLLLAPPAGPRVTIGLDPSLKTGVKVAIIDATGKSLDTAIIYPHPPRSEWDDAISTLNKMAVQHQASLVAIGNGTAARETNDLVTDLIKKYPQLKLTSVMVSESGASVYSASELASKELPDMDVSLRGAVSIARQLQDPLAELVKIDPKSIGVGQYQHDVDQVQLAYMLDTVVKDSVNTVGVEVNTASPALLRYVAGLDSKIAHNIIAYRNAKGPFTQRLELLHVPHLGPKTFEQAAGFLLITGGANPLDASIIHPESYPLVEKILNDIKLNVNALIGNQLVLRSILPEKYSNEKFGLSTVKDILRELEKPGRDPRCTFKTAIFKEGISNIKDLYPAMVLEGVITNVAAFGAFVNIGVHQDGLIHISELADKFVKDVHTIVKVGQIVKVKVLKKDENRNRISLTMRFGDMP